MIYKEQKQYRLTEYDYGGAGVYFVTICVKDRLPVLSTVGTCRGTFLHDHAFPSDDAQNRQDFELILSPIGEAVKYFWLEIPNRFLVVCLDEWVIMPDHFHGLIQLGNGLEWRKGPDDGNVPRNENAPRRVPTRNGLQPLKPDSISSIINHFKGNVKRWCNQNGYEEFSWQPRFYDHIVRNDQDLIRIQEYIRQNPERWWIKNNS